MVAGSPSPLLKQATLLSPPRSELLQLVLQEAAMGVDGYFSYPLHLLDENHLPGRIDYRGSRRPAGWLCRNGCVKHAPDNDVCAHNNDFNTC